MYCNEVHTDKVVAMIVYSNKCTICDIATIMREEPMEHNYRVHNYMTGSSKAIGASVVLELILSLYSQGISVESIVSDND